MVWSLHDGSKIALGDPANKKAINHVVFEGETRIVSGDSDGECRIYDKSGFETFKLTFKKFAFNAFVYGFNSVICFYIQQVF